MNWKYKHKSNWQQWTILYCINRYEVTFTAEPHSVSYPDKKDGQLPFIDMCARSIYYSNYKSSELSGFSFTPNH